MLVENFKKSFNHKKASGIFDILCIRDACVFHSNGDISAVIELKITKLDEREKIEEINRKLCDYFEIFNGDLVNTELIFYQQRTIDVRKVKIRGGPNKEIAHFLNQKRENFINQNRNMITLNHVAITLKKPAEDLGEKRSFKSALKSLRNKAFSYTREYTNERTRILNNCCEKLTGLYVDEKGSPLSKRLDDIGIVRFYSSLLNHKEDTASIIIDDIFRNDIIISRKEKTFRYNGHYHSILTIRKRGVPKLIEDDFTSFLFSEEIIETPFCVFNSLLVPDKEKELENIQNMRSFAETMLGVPGLRKKKLQMRQQIANFEEIEYVCRDEHYRIVDVSFSVMLWAESLEQLDLHINKFQTLASGHGFVFTIEAANLPLVFKSMFPGQFSANKIRFKMMTGNSRCLLPIMHTPVISDNPKSRNLVYFYNQYGDVVKYDTFDNRCTNWNFLTVGSSGSGKSFFSNQLLFQQLPSDPKIFIVDKGGSYKRLIENIGGTYIAVDYNSGSDFSINFFDGPHSTEKEIFLIAVLEQMIVDKSSQYISKAYKSVFQEMIQQAYHDSNNNEGDVLSLDVFVHEYMEMNEYTKKLVPSLKMYIDDGSYASFFKKTKIQ